MGKPSVYVETTVISYLTAHLSRNIVTAAHQRITRRWWSRHRRDFDLFASIAVRSEALGGDPKAATRRLRILDQMDLLEATDEARALAKRLVERGPIPPKAAEDAMHIALATVHGIDYLMTWNCRHINNAFLRHAVDNICLQAGFEPPIICTPEELMLRNQS